MTTTSQTTVQTPDGPMHLYEALARRRSPARRDRRDPGGLRRQRAHRGRHPPVRRRRLPRRRARPVPPRRRRHRGLRRLRKVMPLFKGMSDAGALMDVDAALAHLRARRLPRRADRPRRLLLRRPRLLPGRRIGRSAPAVGFYGGGIVTARFRRFPPLIGERAEPRARRGSACSATWTRASRSRTSRRLRATLAKDALPTPRSCATPTPTTGSTATCAPRTTRPRRRTPGRGCSTGSDATCPIELARLRLAARGCAACGSGSGRPSPRL